MSVSWKINVTQKQLVTFLASEYRAESGIPVHLFSHIETRYVGICDNIKGALFFNSPYEMTAWGDNNPLPIIRALRRCGVKFKALCN